jgi:tRNA synthetases class II core domain (F)/Ferredoxin-fold anticodon binding domain
MALGDPTSAGFRTAFRVPPPPLSRSAAGPVDEPVSDEERECPCGDPERHPGVHPYTLGGRQVDVCWEGEWIEVAECGLAHPEVLQRAGLAGWSGLALGMGLDRLLMLRKGIPDIRLLRSTDPRIAGQMTDLAPWRPVSTMPPVRRDLSVAVEADDTAEELGDRVREALGPDADAVEEVGVLAETRYDRLPAQARARLGIRPGQKNVLVRVVLRHLERTLPDEEANRMRDRIYAALHRGSAHQWAARSRQMQVPTPGWTCGEGRRTRPGSACFPEPHVSGVVAPQRFEHPPVTHRSGGRRLVHQSITRLAGTTAGGLNDRIPRPPNSVACCGLPSSAPARGCFVSRRAPTPFGSLQNP